MNNQTRFNKFIKIYLNSALRHKCVKYNSLEQVKELSRRKNILRIEPVDILLCDILQKKCQNEFFLEF